MNLVELAKAMTEGQIATSRQLKTQIIYKEMGFYESYQGEQVNDIMLSCDMNYLLTEDWEIELPYVDFWTAWQAARDEGWAIVSEFADHPYIYSNGIYPTPEMINGRWQILNQ